MLLSNYTARSGLIAQQQRMDIIANNMANISTVGYKSVRADFKDMLYQTMARPVQPQDELNLQRGHGTLLGATTRYFQQGPTQTTFNPLDTMLSGDGFYTIQDPYGNTRYTRDGSFALSVEDDGAYLVTGSGHYVLNTDGERINLKKDVQQKDIEITKEGKVFVVERKLATQTAPASVTRFQVGTLGIVTFMNRMGLSAESSNLFMETPNSGPPIAAEDLEEGAPKTIVLQGMLEGANLDLPTEMVRMIRAQRAFSLASRALTTADEMDAKANQLRG